MNRQPTKYPLTEAPPEGFDEAFAMLQACGVDYFDAITNNIVRLEYQRRTQTGERQDEVTLMHWLLDKARKGEL